MCTGLGGCYCTMCTVSQADGKSMARVLQWFTINQSIQQVTLNWMQMCEIDDNGFEFIDPKKWKDYSVRQGLTRKPITKEDMCKVTICNNGGEFVFKGFIPSWVFWEMWSLRTNLLVQTVGTKQSKNISMNLFGKWGS